MTYIVKLSTALITAHF